MDLFKSIHSSSVALLYDSLFLMLWCWFLSGQGDCLAFFWSLWANNIHVIIVSELVLQVTDLLIINRSQIFIYLFFFTSDNKAWLVYSQWYKGLYGSLYWSTYKLPDIVLQQHFETLNFYHFFQTFEQFSDGFIPTVVFWVLMWTCSESKTLDLGTFGTSVSLSCSSGMKTTSAWSWLNK